MPDSSHIRFALKIEWGMAINILTYTYVCLSIGWVGWISRNF